jgi:hypothetical protein
MSEHVFLPIQICLNQFLVCSLSLWTIFHISDLLLSIYEHGCRDLGGYGHLVQLVFSFSSFLVIQELDCVLDFYQFFLVCLHPFCPSSACFVIGMQQVQSLLRLLILQCVIGFSQGL